MWIETHMGWGVEGGGGGSMGEVKVYGIVF